MNKLSIKIDESELNKSKYGAITAPIYFDLNGSYQFPEKRWSDFPVAVLASWLKAVFDLHKIREKYVTLDFMDGPMKVDVSLEGNSLEMIFIERKFSRQISERKIEIPFSLFKKELIKTSQSVIKACEERKWNTDDVFELKKSLDALALINEERYIN